jgi:predicted ATPase
MLRGDADLALRFANTILEFSRERGMPLFVALGTACRGWARAKLGEREEGIAELRRGLTDFSEQGNKTYVPFLQVHLAEIEVEGQDGDKALARIDEALTLVGATGEQWTDALLHRIRGEILLKRNLDDIAPVEEALLTAIAVAQQQEARSFELRAAISIARLWRDQGKRDKAYDLLAPVYGWFTEAFDTLDLKEAKALLDELHA